MIAVKSAILGARTMPVSERERQVLLLKLKVVMVPEESEAISMAEAVEFLKEVFAAGEASMMIGENLSDDEGADQQSPTDGENIVRIKDIAIDADGIATILLQHGDTAAADPALIEIASGIVRKAGKTRSEGVAHGSHVIISTKKHVSNAGFSYSLLERVPNLGRSTVLAFLNRLLRHHATKVKLQYKDHEDGRMKRCHPKLASHQQMSRQLKSDLTAGRLSRIEFITHHVVGGFEEPNSVIPVTSTIVHKVVNSPTGHKVFDLIERAKVFAKQQNFEEMQLRLRRTDTNQNISPRFATDLDDAQDAVYSRFEVLPAFAKPLEQCPQQFVDELRKRMISILNKPEMWK